MLFPLRPLRRHRGSKMSVAAVDGDVVLYRAAWACERHSYEWVHEKSGASFGVFQDARSAKEWYDGQGRPAGLKRVTHTHTELPHVVRGIIGGMMMGILRDTGADTCQVYLSDSRCWRHDIAKTREYKGNRPDRPVLYTEAKRVLLQDWDAYVAPGMEADDALAMLAADCEEAHETCIICSIDKDLLTIPGLHFNFVTGEWRTVGRVEAWRRLMSQVLTGDSTDNIPGLPKVGEKNKLVRALDEMDDPGEMARHVREAYREKMGDGWEAYLWEMANLVFIRPDPELYLNENLRPVRVTDKPGDEGWGWP